MTTTMDHSKLEALLEKMVGDMGAAAVAPLVIVGDRLGLYKALAGNGPMTSDDLAEATGTTVRSARIYVSEARRRLSRSLGPLLEEEAP